MSTAREAIVEVARRGGTHSAIAAEPPGWLGRRRFSERVRAVSARTAYMYCSTSTFFAVAVVGVAGLFELFGSCGFSRSGAGGRVGLSGS